MNVKKAQRCRCLETMIALALFVAHLPQVLLEAAQSCTGNGDSLQRFPLTGSFQNGNSGDPDAQHVAFVTPACSSATQVQATERSPGRSVESFDAMPR